MSLPTDKGTAQSSTFDWQLIMTELESTSNEGLTAAVRGSAVKITELADEKGFNLLHHAVLKEVPGKVKALIHLATQYQNATREEISSWTNAVTLND